MISEKINSDKAIIGIIAYLILLSCKDSGEGLSRGFLNLFDGKYHY